MKIFYLFLFLILISPSVSYAQEYSRDFGVISKEEWDLKTYDKDPEAPAVILFDQGKSIFFDTDEGDYDIRFTRTKRIKILKEAGIDYAEIAIPYYQDGFGKTEEVVSIEAYTYSLEDGSLTRAKLDQNLVYKEKKNNNWYCQKFTLPDVKVGSIIEYKYVVETPFLFNLPGWVFQTSIPTIFSVYQVSMIPFYKYAFLAQGIKHFDYRLSEEDRSERTFGKIVQNYGQNIGSGVVFHDLVHTFAMKNVPAFNDESYITSVDDYIMKVDFQLSNIYYPTGGAKEIMTTWPGLCESLNKHENFGKYVKSCTRSAKKVLESEIDLNGMSQTEKSIAIIEFVRSHYSWNQINSKYASKNSKQLLTEKSGNNADINLFLLALLRTAGVDADPVIISTRNHGKIKVDYPFEYFFNYVVVLVKIDNKSYLTDGTNDLIAYNEIPPSCINEKGLLVDDEELAWISLVNHKNSIDSKNIRIKIDANHFVGEASVSINTSVFESFWYKNSFQNDTAKIREHLLKRGFSKVNMVSSFNFDRNRKPYVISFDSEFPVEQLGNKLVVSPFLNFPIRENKLKQKTRSYPVDFIYSKTEEYNSIIEIPSGYQINSLPGDYHFSDDLVDIEIKFKNGEELIGANASYTLKKSVYQPNEYTTLKHCLDTIVKKFNEQIVFEKI
ncbi:DUF3857 and transglutaminase domain-containing protein [uncultured Sunxiuqinia sp.]|uniref:DUF3857 and transglutaminase domain-containing protein n=1 Tax=uncultured Sunxiuqinia sp. TaxID=1573825 RepID=UPI002AA945F2|nr:DUF3857 and transglutaminase domain-containing protein [uncultured Sunxiuqinia sp.]